MKKIIISLILILCLTFTLIACTPDDTEVKGDPLYIIDSIESLVSMQNKLGKGYADSVFELKADIDFKGADFKPIGFDANNAFFGTLKGNGHTISNLNLVPTADTGVSGLFGYTNNATIGDVKLDNVVFDKKLTIDNNSLGLLVGFAYGNTSVNNIEVNGSILSNITTYNVIAPGSGKTEKKCNQNAYIGGIIGYSFGTLKMASVTSTIEAGINYEYADDLLEYEGAPIIRLKNAYVGGLVGYMRGSANEIKNSVVKNIKIDTYSVNMQFGGIIGMAYDTTISNCILKNNGSSIKFDLTDKANIGGISGLADKTEIKNSDSEWQLTILTKGSINHKSAAINVGGIVGYATNLSIVDQCKTEIELISRKSTYVGGIVGNLSNSNIDGCTAKGAYYLDETKNQFPENALTYENRYAGLVGRMFGSSVLKASFASVLCYQGAVAEVVEYNKVDENGLSLEHAMPEVKEDVEFDQNLAQSMFYEGSKEDAKFNRYGTPKEILA